MTGERTPDRSRVSPVLVAREDALALVERRWASARSGAGHLLLVAGEAGIGKTRMLHEAISALAAREAVVAASAFPSDSGAPGALLYSLAADLMRRGRVGEGRALEGVLLDERSDKDAPRRRRLLVAELALQVERVLGKHPTLLAVEDVHWADELSLDVLDRLATALPVTSTLMLATYRSDEVAPGSALRSWRARLLAQRRAEELRLARLEPSAIADVAEAIVGSRPDPAMLDLLVERSDGIPLHIEELLAAGSVDAVPETVADAVLARVRELATEERATLAAASVVGRSFDARTLAGALGETEASVLALLAPSVDRQLLVARQGGWAFDFRHALIRDAVYAGIPAARRRELHAAIAAAGSGMRPAVLSSHWEHAGRSEDAHRTALQAALEAARVSAHREAVECLRRAARTIDPEASIVERAALGARLGTELAAVDDNRAAAEELERSADLYRRAGDAVAAAELVPRLMAVRHLLGDGLEARISLARDALADLDGVRPRRQDLEAELLAAMAAAHMLDRRLEPAADLARRARALAPTGASGAALRSAIDTTLGSVLVFAGEGDEGWALLEAASTEAEQAGLEAEAARAHRMHASCASVLVEHERAERALTVGLPYTASVERWNDHHYLVAHLAHVRWAAGEWRESERQARLALAAGDGVTTRITALHVLGFLALGHGRGAEAAEHLHEALRLGERMGELQRVSPALWGLAELAAQRSEFEAAEELCRRGQRASAEVDDAAYLFPFVALGTRVLLAKRQLDEAASWVSDCSEALRRRAIPGTLPAVPHAEGLLRLAEGRTGEAATLLGEAAEGWRARRRFWEGSWAALDLAGCLVRSRRPSAAHSLASEVAAAAAAVGSGPLQSAAARIRAAGSGSPLSPRERAVAELVADGATNRQIAAALVLSVSTVAAHVEHILAKLGAARRAEIAAWVATERREGR